MKTQSMRYKTLKINNSFMLKLDRKMLAAFFGPLILHRSFKRQSIINNIDKIKYLERNKLFLNMKKSKIPHLKFKMIKIRFQILAMLEAFNC